MCMCVVVSFVDVDVVTVFFLCYLWVIWNVGRVLWDLFVRRYL